MCKQTVYYLSCGHSTTIWTFCSQTRDLYAPSFLDNDSLDSDDQVNDGGQVDNGQVNGDGQFIRGRLSDPLSSANTQGAVQPPVTGVTEAPCDMAFLEEVEVEDARVRCNEPGCNYERVGRIWLCCKCRVGPNRTIYCKQTISFSGDANTDAELSWCRAEETMVAGTEPRRQRSGTGDCRHILCGRCTHYGRRLAS